MFIQSAVNLLFAFVGTKLVSCLPKAKEGTISEVELSASPSPAPKRKQDQGEVSKLWLALELSVPALCQTISGYMGNKSLEYIDLTAKTVFKSMKPVPILLMGWLMGMLCLLVVGKLNFEGNKYHGARYIGVFALSVGITTFMMGLGKSSGSGEAASLFGLVLALSAVFMDGFVGSSQERITRLYKPSSFTLMASVNIWGLVISGVSK